MKAERDFIIGFWTAISFTVNCFNDCYFELTLHGSDSFPLHLTGPEESETV